MHLKTRNVNTAFRDLMSIFHDPENGPGMCEFPDTYPGVDVIRRPSRNGNVLMINEPVTVTYTHPRERVLFNAVRDANPFFHLYESLWMLSGRNDVASVVYYTSRMKEFSDDGKTLNGAYGHRWRKASTYSGTVTTATLNEVDQLEVIVNHLRTDPNSRRAVLQMWNVENDLLKIGPEREDSPIRVTSKDVCCNLSVMFSLREELQQMDIGDIKIPTARVLDMTVTNRSNDLLWGMLGANYVHFTFLQEYMAARLGCGVGVYHHFSNNLHVYEERGDWKPTELLAWFEKDNKLPSAYRGLPLVKDPVAFDKELPDFVDQYAKPDEMDRPLREYTEPFLRDVAQPMFDAFLTYKRRGATTSMWISRIAADDWRIAARNWVEKRLKTDRV